MKRSIDSVSSFDGVKFASRRFIQWQSRTVRPRPRRRCTTSGRLLLPHKSVMARSVPGTWNRGNSELMPHACRSREYGWKAARNQCKGKQMLKLKARNFRRFQETDLVTFQQGLTIVSGPNGAG